MSKNRLSNAPEGYADELYGFPTFYPIGGDGKPVGAPYLVFDGQNFKDLKELNSYKKRLAERNQEEVYDVPCTGTLNPEDLTVEDWQVFSQVPKLWQNYHTIFATSPIGKGVQDPGTLGMKVDLDTYNGILKPFL